MLNFENASGFDTRSENALTEQNRMIDAVAATMLFSKGTVEALGYNENGSRKLKPFSEVVSVSSSDFFTYGLRKNGTVVSTKLVSDYTPYGLSERYCIPSWKDIVAISAASDYVAGLTSSGTVKIYGNFDGNSAVASWTDIIQISAARSHIVGLKKDGTVVAVGNDSDGRCDVSEWKDIVHISAGDTHTVAARADGTVVATGANDCGQCSVSCWKNIKMVSTSIRHTVGLTVDGQVVATSYAGPLEFNAGQCSVGGWSDIVQISAGPTLTLGLRKDGTVVATQCTLCGPYDYQFQVLSKADGYKLFSDYSDLEKEREIAFDEQRILIRKINDLCPYCGGKYKGLFSKVCKECGRKKDY